MIRVVVAEDMHMVRGALVSLLGLEGDIAVVAELASGDGILPAVREHKPDVAVLDIDLPGTDGLTAAAQVAEQAPQTRTLILTALGRPANLRRALAAKAGGFLLKDAPPEELAEGIRGVHAGRRVVDGQLALEALDSQESPLTARELDVLRLMAEGADAAEVAKRLFLTTGTVRNYLTSVTTKLNARNRVDAVRIAREEGWL
ncbi:two-component system response regulator DesR [Lipingzhangella halophila]|uniref:Two-component system response regulator DesR n=1 Tax=Lipingzhangella halophila TaxID=1783352 RepID=A0A7W7RJW5_9ACTN|nr:response regulator transcription factor [Lipingzhangella halophila]MBB4933291.1 two-component system response regulator DesR [Lipingzhangella halophila]